MSTGTQSIASRPMADASNRSPWGLPSSSPGRWSLGLAALFWLCMAVFYGLVAAGVAERGNDTFAQEWPLFISIGAAGACGIGSAVTGVVALLAKHERSVLVALATLLGALVTFFVLAELLFPH